VNQILNEVKKLAQSHQVAYMRVGTVVSYDSSNYTVKVRLQPEDAITGWLPLVSTWVGNGWGLFSPPSVGDQLEVQFHDGDFDAGVACQRFFNDSSRPLSVPSGEFWLVHSSGSMLKLTNEGKVLLGSSTQAGDGRLYGTFQQPHAPSHQRWKSDWGSASDDGFLSPDNGGQGELNGRPLSLLRKRP
jgi:hypothetical protein